MVGKTLNVIFLIVNISFHIVVSLVKNRGVENEGLEAFQTHFFQLSVYPKEEQNLLTSPSLATLQITQWVRKAWL